MMLSLRQNATLNTSGCFEMLIISSIGQSICWFITIKNCFSQQMVCMCLHKEDKQ